MDRCDHCSCSRPPTPTPLMHGPHTCGQEVPIRVPGDCERVVLMALQLHDLGAGALIDEHSPGVITHLHVCMGISRGDQGPGLKHLTTTDVRGTWLQAYSRRGVA
jgi:hypothetical protein